MDKKVLKKKLEIFYKKLSLLRRKSKPSKSMSWTILQSDLIMDSIIWKMDLHKKSIADIGGAGGEFIFHLVNLFNKKNKITLIDISPHYLLKAKKNYNSKFKGRFSFNTILSNVDDLKIKNKFDIIFFRSILEHLYFPDNTMKNINHSLKDNGLLALITPNRNRLNELLKKIIPERLKFRLKLKLGTDLKEVMLLEKKMGLKEHIHEYSLRELKTLLKRHNFEIEKARYSTIPFIIPSLCDKYPFIFKVQKSIILFMNFIGLNKFWGFDFIVLARKK